MFLKWAGGKTQIMDTLFTQFPRDIHTYYEPFVGGGSVLIHILHQLEMGTIHIQRLCISDINTKLINCYLQVKHHVDEVCMYLNQLRETYRTLPLKNTERTAVAAVVETKEQYYYQLRGKFTDTYSDTSYYAALFIFINKTCFRGLYRESKGKFNVPFGHYEDPTIYNEDDLCKLSELFTKYNVEFKTAEFTHALESNTCNDFIYMDPPYYPILPTSFVGYYGGEFDHDSLVNAVKGVSARFILSNADCEWVRQQFKGYPMIQVLCKRRIHSKKPSAKQYELLIKSAADFAADF